MTDVQVRKVKGWEVRVRPEHGRADFLITAIAPGRKHFIRLERQTAEAVKVFDPVKAWEDR